MFRTFVQEPDLRYLVENIWNSQSVLSAHEDLFDLLLVRWNKYEEWSPWNCILLTKDEASAHGKLENVTEVPVCFVCYFYLRWGWGTHTCLVNSAHLTLQTLMISIKFLLIILTLCKPDWS